ncbi:MAG: hypothetical protein C4555_04425 [Dehalococcoidia bacterium]|nr:MAG: hypothetical protein C4555_04425 [Dehalococcoidia bacterium]
MHPLTLHWNRTLSAEDVIRLLAGDDGDRTAAAEAWIRYDLSSGFRPRLARYAYTRFENLDFNEVMDVGFTTPPRAFNFLLRLAIKSGKWQEDWNISPLEMQDLFVKVGFTKTALIDELKASPTTVYSWLSTGYVPWYSDNGSDMVLDEAVWGARTNYAVHAIMARNLERAARHPIDHPAPKYLAKGSRERNGPIFTVTDLEEALDGPYDLRVLEARALVDMTLLPLAILASELDVASLTVSNWRKNGIDLRQVVNHYRIASMLKVMAPRARELLLGAGSKAVQAGIQVLENWPLNNRIANLEQSQILFKRNLIDPYNRPERKPPSFYSDRVPAKRFRRNPNAPIDGVLEIKPDPDPSPDEPSLSPPAVPAGPPPAPDPERAVREAFGLDESPVPTAPLTEEERQRIRAAFEG